MKKIKHPYGGLTMVIYGASRILLLTLVVAMMLSVTSCKPVEKADVLGTYVKVNEQPVKFRTSNTEIILEGTDGRVTLKLRADDIALLGDNKLSWTLNEGKVIIYLFNASISGDFKRDIVSRDKIVDLGGEGIIWKKL